jgi:hypothetical protein
MPKLRELLSRTARALSVTAAKLNGLLQGGRTDGTGTPAVLA